MNKPLLVIAALNGFNAAVQAGCWWVSSELVYAGVAIAFALAAAVMLRCAWRWADA